MRLPFLLAPGWLRYAGLALLPLLGGLGLLAWILFSSQSPPPPAPAQPAATALALPPVPGLLVHVVGAVASPGIYRLKRGDRVYAAIAAAGGLTSEADPARLPDLAGLLRDGQQVKVPPRGASAGGRGSSKLSLSTATPEQLASLPGFTPDLVDAVLQYRDDFGGFKTTKELVTALGMSQAAYNAVKRDISP